MREADRSVAMSILEMYNMAPRPPTPELPDPERAELAVDRTLVAEFDGMVVGLCSYLVHSPELVETASLAVHPDWRGHGIGLILQQKRLQLFRQKGFRKVRTETDRPEVADWYIRHFGYRTVGKNPKKHCFGRPEIDYWTVLELSIPPDDETPPESH